MAKAENSRRLAWSIEETEILLEVWKKHQLSLRVLKRNYQVYSRLTLDLKRRGISRTVRQVHMKIDSLTQKYRNIRLKTPDKERASQQWPFYKKVDEILSLQPRSRSSQHSPPQSPVTQNNNLPSTIFLLSSVASTSNSSVGTVPTTVSQPISQPSNLTLSPGVVSRIILPQNLYPQADTNKTTYQSKPIKPKCTQNSPLRKTNASKNSMMLLSQVSSPKVSKPKASSFPSQKVTKKTPTNTSPNEKPMELTTTSSSVNDTSSLKAFRRILPSSPIRTAPLQNPATLNSSQKSTPINKKRVREILPAQRTPSINDSSYQQEAFTTSQSSKNKIPKILASGTSNFATNLATEIILQNDLQKALLPQLPLSKLYFQLTGLKAPNIPVPKISSNSSVSQPQTSAFHIVPSQEIPLSQTLPSKILLAPAHRIVMPHSTTDKAQKTSLTKIELPQPTIDTQQASIMPSIIKRNRPQNSIVKLEEPKYTPLKSKPLQSSKSERFPTLKTEQPQSTRVDTSTNTELLQSAGLDSSQTPRADLLPQKTTHNTSIQPPNIDNPQASIPTPMDKLQAITPDKTRTITPMEIEESQANQVEMSHSSIPNRSSTSEVDTIQTLTPKNEDANQTATSQVKLQNTSTPKIDITVNGISKIDIIETITPKVEKTSTSQDELPKASNLKVDLIETITPDIEQNITSQDELTPTFTNDTIETITPDIEKTTLSQLELPNTCNKVEPTTTSQVELPPTFTNDTMETITPDIEKTTSKQAELPNTCNIKLEPTTSSQVELPPTFNNEMSEAITPKIAMPKIEKTTTSQVDLQPTFDNDTIETITPDIEKTTTSQNELPNACNIKIEQTTTSQVELPPTFNNDTIETITPDIEQTKLSQVELPNTCNIKIEPTTTSQVELPPTFNNDTMETLTPDIEQTTLSQVELPNTCNIKIEQTTSSQVNLTPTFDNDMNETITPMIDKMTNQVDLQPTLDNDMIETITPKMKQNTTSQDELPNTCNIKIEPTTTSQVELPPTIDNGIIETITSEIEQTTLSQVELPDTSNLKIDNIQTLAPKIEQTTSSQVELPPTIDNDMNETITPEIEQTSTRQDELLNTSNIKIDNIQTLAPKIEQTTSNQVYLSHITKLLMPLSSSEILVPIPDNIMVKVEVLNDTDMEVEQPQPEPPHCSAVQTSCFQSPVNADLSQNMEEETQKIVSSLPASSPHQPEEMELNSEALITIKEEPMTFTLDSTETLPADTSFQIAATERINTSLHLEESSGLQTSPETTTEPTSHETINEEDRKPQLSQLQAPSPQVTTPLQPSAFNISYSQPPLPPQIPHFQPLAPHLPDYSYFNLQAPQFHPFSQVAVPNSHISNSQNIQTQQPRGSQQEPFPQSSNQTNPVDFSRQIFLPLISSSQPTAQLHEALNDRTLKRKKFNHMKAYHKKKLKLLQKSLKTQEKILQNQEKLLQIAKAFLKPF